MIKIISFCICLLPAVTQATLSEKFHSGDVLLMALNCRICPMIEKEEQGDYSHSGVVIKKGSHIYVANSLGNVQLMNLQQFINKKRPGTKIAHMRPKEFIVDPLAVPTFSEMSQVFYDHYEGLPFDFQFLWNNVDRDGQEVYYCSEFVAKFLNEFVTNKFEPRPMDYTDYWEFWEKIFQGRVPQGELGNSPVSLFRDERLHFLSFL